MADFCTKCGSPLGGARFCTNCGTPAAGSGAAQAPAAPAYDASYAETQVMAPVDAVPAAYAAAPQPASQAPAHTPAAPAQPKRALSGAKIAIVAAACVVGIGAGVAFAIAQPWAGSSDGEQAPMQPSSSSAPVEEASESAVSVAQQETSSQDVADQSQQAKPYTLKTPDVVGLSEADATKAIEEAGLALGAVVHEKSEDVAKGNVISQNPAAGTEMAAGTSVGLTVSDGKAEHRYELVAGSYTWSEARSAAESRGGYLACITSAQEWDKVRSVLPGSGIAVVWAGAQADSSRNFAWVSGEDFSYSAWASGEPNNDGGTEDRLCLLCANGNWGWYDVPNDVSSYYPADKMGFIVEYED